MIIINDLGDKLNWFIIEFFLYHISKFNIILYYIYFYIINVSMY